MAESAQYDTVILQGDFYEKFDKLGEIVTKIDHLLTHWSVAQVRMMKNTGSRKSRWNVPLNRIRKSHMTLRSMIPEQFE